MDMLGKILKWEEEGMEKKEMVEFFQELIDSELAWKLQGCYGRQAVDLIRGGLCKLRKGEKREKKANHVPY